MITVEDLLALGFMFTERHTKKVFQMYLNNEITFELLKQWCERFAQEK